MAGLNPESRRQIAAIARVRWQVFSHSLRSGRGALELFSRIIIGIVILTGGLGGAALLGAGAWYFVSGNKPEEIGLLLWPVFLFWQLFPVMASALTETIDSSELLRFPLRYHSYVLVRLAYGALDPATVLGGLWLIGISLGVGWAQPNLLPWTALLLSLFALVNMLLTQMVFAWVERWLAQRRTREIFAVIFFLAMLSLQFLGPLLHRYGDRSSILLHKLERIVSPAQQALPPGIATAALTSAVNHNPVRAAAFFLLLSLYAAVFLRILSIRLRAQYRGENLSEVSRDAARKNAPADVPLGWSIPGISGPVAAVLEKELRYLGRSGPMLLTFVTPVIMLVVFGMRGRPESGFLEHSPDLALPIGAGYALLLLTNLIYNNFGADAGGVQFFLTSPASFRAVILGKNLAHLAVLLAEILLLAIGTSFLFRPPSFYSVLLTLTGLLFAAPMNLAVGNLMSLYSPKKIEFGTFGRQRASQLTVLASLILQLLVFGILALTLFAARYYGKPWLAIVMFLVLAAAAVAVYGFTLERVDRLALKRREVLATELSKQST